MLFYNSNEQNSLMVTERQKQGIGEYSDLSIIQGKPNPSKQPWQTSSSCLRGQNLTLSRQTIFYLCGIFFQPKFPSQICFGPDRELTTNTNMSNISTDLWRWTMLLKHSKRNFAHALDRRDPEVCEVALPMLPRTRLGAIEPRMFGPA